MIKKVFYFVVILFCANAANAQCATTEVMKDYYQGREHEYQQAMTQFANELNAFRQNAEKSSLNKSAAKRIIPVVFHVIHTYGDENISKAQIEDQIRVLNEQYSASNANINTVRSDFTSYISDMNIEFRLATKDPDGNCTDGINRIYSKLTDNARDNVKSLIRWNNEKYLNVWVVKTIRNQQGVTGTTLGYAYLPQSLPGTANLDGIVVRADYVGTIGTSSTAKAGSTLTHEVGHYLGLLHPFENGCGDDCASSGDYVCDTPPVEDASFGCNKNANTCHNDVPDMPDQVENFMDYADGSCQAMFTIGQKTIVDYYLTNTRYTLISPGNLSATGVEPLVVPNCKPIADFSNDTITVCAGNQVTFTNVSYRGTPTTITWTFTGGSPATSSAANPTITYSNVGTYNVTLEVSNGQGSSSLTRNAIVRVLPSVAALKAPASQQFTDAAFPPSNWNIEASGSTNRWQRSTVNYGGTAGGSAYVNINASATVDATAGLISEPIDLSPLTPAAYLNFRVAYKRRSSTVNEFLRIYYSNDCGATWTLLKQYLGSQMAATGDFFTGTNWMPSQTSEWMGLSIPITTPTVKTNLLYKFEVVIKGGNNVFIDDIYFTNSTSQIGAGIENLAVGDLNIYPVPTKNEVTVSGELFNAGKKVSIAVTDITGRTILIDQLQVDNQNRFNYNIAAKGLGLTNGVYFITLESEGRSTHHKFMVND